MSKIMLVEDDNNLREIYEARLLAEGYEIVSAHDGEEALALAVKEKPDLIISDVMMPKISGFDMLDILRSTPETKDTKVIMMTALSQAEDKERADKLGADRYLVKSQVTLEDVAKIAREVIEGTGAAPRPAAIEETMLTTPQPVATVATPPAAVADTPVVAPPADPMATTNSGPITPVDSPLAPILEPVMPYDATVPSTQSPVESAQTSSDELSTVTEQINQFVSQTPALEVTPEATPASDAQSRMSGAKVIQPINDPTAKPDLDKLLADEEKKTTSTGTIVSPQTDAAMSSSNDPNLISL